MRRLNPDYKQVGSRYEHIVIWEAHHGRTYNKRTHIIHHHDENKKNNHVCDRPAPCPVLNCGNLHLLSRREHILQHKPGKMSGQKGFVDTRPRKRRAQ